LINQRAISTGIPPQSQWNSSPNRFQLILAKAGAAGSFEVIQLLGTRLSVPDMTTTGIVTNFSS
jgi:hypothetical protein